ncbi:hypothetical protein A8B78_01480 [Jannaschia sp. EhC01]|nr:hypothetical protein A8B78_01480 [Jannaschia sp. EhC01]
MWKAVFGSALVLTVSACLSVGVTFQRWVGTYEYDGTTYRVALVASDRLDGETELEYHLVPGDTVTYGPQDMIARCSAFDEANWRQVDVRRCEQPFARAIDALAGPPMMGADDY